jgi:lipoate-protein ligase A
MSGRDLLVWRDPTRDPHKNADREEVLFQRVESGSLPEFVRFWVNSECLVRGRAKHAKYGWYDEILAKEMKIDVVERTTGGGVVYHDEGNLNWGFFLRNNGALPSPSAMFGDASRYVTEALGHLGIRALFSPPNRIDVEGRKVSGMAARSTPKALLVHGTLLLKSNLERLNQLCIPPAGCPPVANLSEWVEDIEASKVVKALVDVLDDSGFNVKLTDSIPGF